MTRLPVPCADKQAKLGHVMGQKLQLLAENSTHMTERHLKSEPQLQARLRHSWLHLNAVQIIGVTAIPNPEPSISLCPLICKSLREILLLGLAKTMMAMRYSTSESGCVEGSLEGLHNVSTRQNHF